MTPRPSFTCRNTRAVRDRPGAITHAVCPVLLPSAGLASCLLNGVLPRHRGPRLCPSWFPLHSVLACFGMDAVGNAESITGRRSPVSVQASRALASHLACRSAQYWEVKRTEAPGLDGQLGPMWRAAARPMWREREDQGLWAARVVNVPFPVRPQHVSHQVARRHS